jgi:excisionase family DNA binding protein
MPDLQEVKPTFSDFHGRWNVSQLLYSLEDAWTTLGVGRSTLYELIAAGDIKAVKVGRRTLIRHDELERYVQDLPERTQFAKESV